MPGKRAHSFNPIEGLASHCVALTLESSLLFENV
jgi:hypothetical protein